MLRAALTCRRREHKEHDQSKRARLKDSQPPVTGHGETRDEVADSGSALTLDFFLRMVRALERNLAPVSVPSPLVR